MQHKKTIILLVLGALAVTMAFGALAYRTVFAAPSTLSSTDSAATTSIMLSSSSSLEMGRGPFAGTSNEDLATALG
ncbi:MAG: hypothetical protein ACM3H7_07690, partial [Acidobacteriaceae bacterium]